MNLWRSVCGLLLIATAVAHAEQPRTIVASLPVVFEPNRGQVASEAAFVARGRGYRLEIHRRGSLMTLSGDRRDVLRMELAGGSAPAQMEAQEPQPGHSNYLIGPDRSRHITGVPHARKVIARSIYPGIDLAYYGKDGHIEYDFIVSPGADPNKIALRFSGPDATEISADGDLVFRWRDREVRHRKPVLYQQPGGGAVEGRFALGADGLVRFAIGEWDRNKTLVIDPVLVFSSYLGGTASDIANAVAVDGNGDTYVTGTTTSIDFPTPNQGASAGETDAFVTKIAADGSLILYSTYLAGAAADSGRGIAVDAAGSAYVVGQTFSSNFPITGGPTAFCAGGDAFVAKLSPVGTFLLFSICVGGSGVDEANGIALDSASNAYVVGSTSGGLPVVNAAQPTIGGGTGLSPDAFVGRLNSVGTAWDYLTYLGAGSVDVGKAIGANAAGDVCVTGQTQTGFTFPVVNALQPAGGGVRDAFVARYSPSGAVVYATFLGGNGLDEGVGAFVDADGNCYVTGSTASSDFPVMNAAQSASGGGSDAFVTKYNATGSAYVYSTYLGGSTRDDGLAITVAAATGIAHVAGGSHSANFPSLNPIQTAFHDPGTVLVSTNAGASFSRSFEIGTASVTAVALHPVQPQILYAATTAGVYRSTDGGGLWTAVGNLPYPRVLSLAVDPNSPCTIYAGLDVDQPDINSNAILAISTDCGASWGLNNTMPAGRSIRSIALASGAPAWPIMSVLKNTVIEPYTQYTLVRLTPFGAAESSPALNQSSADYTVATDPTDACISYAGDFEGAIYRNTSCTDWNWTRVGSSIAGGVRSIAVHPTTSERLLAGTTSGALYQLLNAGADWTRAATLDGAINSIVFKPGNPQIAYAATDGGSVYRSLDGGTSWAVLSTNGPGISSLAVATAAPDALYASGVNSSDGFLTRFSAAGAILDSTWFGGRGADAVRGIALGPTGHSVLVGHTNAIDLPVTPGAVQPVAKGFGEAFVARVDPTAAPTVPGAPRNLTATVANGTLTLSWLPPDSGAVPTEYVIQVSTDETFSTVIVNHATGSTTPTFVAPNPPVVLWVRLLARAGTISSAPSNVVQVGEPPTPPGPPTLVPTQVVSNPVTVTWSPGPGGAPTSYTVIGGLRPGGAELGVFPVGGVTAVSATVPTNVRIYGRVVAANAAGQAISNEIDFIVVPPVLPHPPTLAPASVGTGGLVTLSWNPAASGGAAASYAVVARLGPTGPVVAVQPGVTATSFSIAAPRGTYFVTLVAVNGAGISAESNQITVVVP